MRTLIAGLLGLSLGCTPKGYCDSVALGQPVPASAQPTSAGSWCRSHPVRHYEGPESLGDAGGEIFSYGPYDPEASEQCCLIVRDGGVIAKGVGYD